MHHSCSKYVVSDRFRVSYLADVLSASFSMLIKDNNGKILKAPHRTEKASASSQQSLSLEIPTPGGTDHRPSVTSPSCSIDSEDDANQRNELRRPITTNNTDIWYCPEARWWQWSTERRPEQRKTALRWMREWDLIGRIMETDEGVDAVEECKECYYDGNITCRMLTTSVGVAGSRCALCIAMHKGHCDAKMIETPTADEEDAVPQPRSNKRATHETADDTP